MIIRMLIVGLAALIISEEASAINLLPDGYRYPNEKDIKYDWEEFRKELPEPYHISEDFNGDGIKDDAWILIQTKEVGWALFVFLSNSKKGIDVINLEDNKGNKYPQTMGLSVMKPGKYKTACGKGYGLGCANDEPGEIELNLPAIDYFHYESSSSTFYWDNPSKSFKRVWMSD